MVREARKLRRHRMGFIFLGTSMSAVHNVGRIPGGAKMEVGTWATSLGKSIDTAGDSIHGSRSSGKC
jgi:hypothetical protein